MIKKLIALMLLTTLSVSAYEYNVKFTNFDHVLVEVIKRHLDTIANKFAKVGTTVKFNYVTTIENTGGISIILTDDFPRCFNYTSGYFYNNEYKMLPLKQLVINDDCLHYYMGYNKVNALLNATAHEVFCHAVTDGAEHLGARNLCAPNLSTDKLYFTKQDLRHINKNIKELD